MKIKFWFCCFECGWLWFWVWQWWQLNKDDVINGIWWGFFGNKNMHKGIDGICRWLESLLFNHVTCTYGICCLDMILIEIIQIVNPRHVIDAMSSMKLNLIHWCFGIIFLCFYLSLWCRKAKQRLVVGNSCGEIMDFLLKTLKDVMDKGRDRSFGSICCLGHSCFIRDVMFFCGLVYRDFLVICDLWVLNLWFFFLKVSLWIEGFFKGLTPCFGFFIFWRFGWSKGVKLPFFPLSISPWANFKEFRDYWGCEWLVLSIRKWFGSWLWIGWLLLYFV